ncbi:hypothetical protein Moror_3691 [Moniliophthora roreri MCA 2997]|uniref:Bacteriophage T5 Orf172 DNA-binding domain-containing protein n=1 Tax=Moniliophthora roreri (strain MCA 2997) TaxID=1381753 RepID=V2W6W8_MONRO|nr:hypothetical protein Moror_3691 [Moniliophthora roreri MCA 2997]
MAIINISTILKYNKPNSVLKQCGGVAPQDAATWVIAKKEKDGDCMDMDKDSKARAQITPPVSDAEQDVVGVPVAFKLSLELTFAMLSHVLKRPTSRASQPLHICWGYTLCVSKQRINSFRPKSRQDSSKRVHIVFPLDFMLSAAQLFKQLLFPYPLYEALQPQPVVLLVKFLQRLTEARSSSESTGDIYCARVRVPGDDQILFKIGRVVDVEKRLQQWCVQHGGLMEVELQGKVEAKYYRRTEELVHLLLEALATQRPRETCTIIKCGQVHQEIFEFASETAWHNDILPVIEAVATLLNEQDFILAA